MSSTAVRRGSSGRTWSRVGYATAAAMWSRTDLRPADVDVAQLYDGFTIEAVWWLEALGFCGTGEAGAFVEGGKRHRARRRAAAQHVGRPALGRAAPRRRSATPPRRCDNFAARRVRGRCPDAEVAVVTNVGGFEAGAALLTR